MNFFAAFEGERIKLWKPNCCKTFSIEHTVNCLKGGFPTLRHNEILDSLLPFSQKFAAKYVLNPDTHPVTSHQLNGASANSQEWARLDVSASGVLGGRFQKTYFDVRVFNRKQKMPAV